MAGQSQFARVRFKRVGVEVSVRIDGTILNPADSKELKRGRTAYWNDEEGIIVITHPNNPDKGTAFRPDDGKAYFDRLK